MPGLKWPKCLTPKVLVSAFLFTSFLLLGLVQNCSKNKNLSLKICNIGQIRPEALSQRELKFIYVYFFKILLHHTEPHSLTGLVSLGFWHFGAWPFNPSLNIL